MIIFINGSINAGKSTVSEILQKMIPDTALVEFDSIRHFIDWLPIDKAIPMVHKVGAEVIKSFAKNNYNVIIPYPLTKESYKKIVSELDNLGTEIHAFTLSPKLEKVITNRGNRELDSKEVDRIHYHYKIKINNPGYGTVIDNSEQNPKETAAELLEIMNNKK